MTSLTLVLGGLLVILVPAFFLWRKADKRGQSMVKKDHKISDLTETLKEKDLQDDKIDEFHALDDDPTADSIVRDAIEGAAKK